MSGKVATELHQKGLASVEQEAALNILRTAQQLNNRTSELLREFGLTVTQYNVLRILRGAGPRGLACSEIGERMIADDPDITRLLDRMVSSGWVLRDRSSKDRRVVLSKITKEASALLGKIDRPLADLMSRTFGTLKRESLRDLIEGLEEVRETLL